MTETVQALVPALGYQESRAHLFPSIESLRWFIRCNKSELTGAGALLEIAGRIRISPEAFDCVVLEVGKRTVRRQGEAVSQ